MLVVEEKRGTKEYSRFVQSWTEQMRQAYAIAKENAGKRKLLEEELWKRRRLASGLSKGDRVLVNNLKERGGPDKIRSYWELW